MKRSGWCGFGTAWIAVVLAAGAARAWELPANVKNYGLFYGSLSGTTAGGCTPPQSYNYLPIVQQWDMAILNATRSKNATPSPGAIGYAIAPTLAQVQALNGHAPTVNGNTRTLAIGYSFWVGHDGDAVQRGVDNGWYAYVDGQGRPQTLDCFTSTQSGGPVCYVDITEPDYQDWYVDEMIAAILRGPGDPGTPWAPGTAGMLDGVFIDLAGHCATPGTTLVDIPGSCAATEAILDRIQTTYPGVILVANTGSYIPGQEVVAPHVNAIMWEDYQTTDVMLPTSGCEHNATLRSLIDLRAAYGVDTILLGDDWRLPTAPPLSTFPGLCADAQSYTPDPIWSNCANIGCGADCSTVSPGFLPYRVNDLGFAAPPLTYFVDNCGTIDHY